MKKRMAVVLVALVLAVVCGDSFAITAAQFHANVMANPNLKKTKGEDFCWHATYSIGGFLKGYAVYKDNAWLDEAVKYFDWVLSKREKTHDGYLGWIGAYENADIGEAIIDDANVFNEILAWCEVVLKDPSLKSKYGGKANEYMKEAIRELVEKWDKRNCYVEDGPLFAAYVRQTIWYDEKKKQWREKKSTRITENLNKHCRAGTCYLKLYRITGEKIYKDRAEKIFSHYKGIMRYHQKENRYIWNFWEPFIPIDIGSKPKGWVEVHPERPGYQAAETEMMAESYHTGIVFSEDDMKKIVNTNLWMWNKSVSKPEFKSADGSTSAGTLWAGLADFDPTIRQIYAVMVKDNNSEVDKEYFSKVIIKEPPSYKRKYATGEVKLPDIPIYPCTDISMAVVIPATFSSGSDTKLCIKSKAKGKLKCELYSMDGKPLASIYTQSIDKANDFFTQKWDGKDPKGGAKLKGDYKVRWDLNGSIMERQITIKE